MPISNNITITNIREVTSNIINTNFTQLTNYTELTNTVTSWSDPALWTTLFGAIFTAITAGIMCFTHYQIRQDQKRFKLWEIIELSFKKEIDRTFPDISTINLLRPENQNNALFKYTIDINLHKNSLNIIIIKVYHLLKKDNYKLTILKKINESINFGQTIIVHPVDPNQGVVVINTCIALYDLYTLIEVLVYMDNQENLNELYSKIDNANSQFNLHNKYCQKFLDSIGLNTNQKTQ